MTAITTPQLEPQPPCINDDTTSQRGEQQQWGWEWVRWQPIPNTWYIYWIYYICTNCPPFCCHPFECDKGDVPLSSILSFQHDEGRRLPTFQLTTWWRWPPPPRYHVSTQRRVFWPSPTLRHIKTQDGGLLCLAQPLHLVFWHNRGDSWPPCPSIALKCKTGGIYTSQLPRLAFRHDRGGFRPPPTPHCVKTRDGLLCPVPSLHVLPTTIPRSFEMWTLLPTATLPLAFWAREGIFCCQPPLPRLKHKLEGHPCQLPPSLLRFKSGRAYTVLDRPSLVWLECILANHHPSYSSKGGLVLPLTTPSLLIFLLHTSLHLRLWAGWVLNINK